MLTIPLTVLRLGDFHIAPLLLLFRKSHARFGCALASAGAAPPLRYQLFCGMRLRRGTLNRMFFIDDIRRSKVALLTTS